MKLMMMVVLSLLWLSGCATASYKEKTITQGAAIGAATGAAIGQQDGNAVEGAVIGAALGALAGAIIVDAKEKRNSANARQSEYKRQQKNANQYKHQDNNERHYSSKDKDDEDGYF